MKRHYLILFSFVALFLLGVTYSTSFDTYAAGGTEKNIEVSVTEYDTRKPNGTNIIVTWKDGRKLENIKQGPSLLIKGTHYSDPKNSNKVSIFWHYLLNQKTGGHGVFPIDLTLEFTEGPPEYITIKIIDDEMKMKLNGNVIVNHIVGTPYDDQWVTCPDEKSAEKRISCSRDDVEIIEGNVDHETVGQYLLKFKNNKTGEEIARRVNVLPLPVTAISTEAGEISVYNAMPNATLVVYDDLEQRVDVGKANKDGEYHFTKIPIGDYYVVQIPYRAYIESQKSNKVNVSGPGAPYLIGSTGGEGTLSVTNATPNAQIKLFNSSDRLIKTMRANKDGEAEFKNIPVGTGYYVIVSHNGVDGAPSNKASVGNVGTVKISGNNLTQTIDVSNAVPNATLKLYDRNDKVVSTGKADKEGNYVFSKVRPGSGYYVIQIHNKNESPKSNLVTISAVPLRNVDISVVTGKSEIVVEGADEGATLTLFDQSGKAVMTGKADKSGKYTFKNVPAGNNYYVIQSVDGRESNQSNKVNVLGDSAVLKDIQGTWAEQSIIALVNIGVINGYPDGTFRPNETITKAEFVSVLVRALNIESTNGKEFADMRNHWARNAVTTAAGRGIIPNSQSHFFPNKGITREEMAYMIMKAKSYSSRSTNLTFRDERHISYWAKPEVHLAVQNRIIFGYNDGTFRPKQTATRAEAAAIIYRAMNR